MTWTCFLLSPTNRFRRSFRRLVIGESNRCPDGGFHDAIVHLDDEVESDMEWHGSSTLPDDTLKADPRWPAACRKCGYVFGPDDLWYDHLERVFTAPDGSAHCLRDRLLAGATYVADWMPDHFRSCTGTYTGPQLHIILPDGYAWHATGPSTSGGGWQLDGQDPCKLTASPSIKSPGYHGWLRDGVLSEDCEGHTF